MSEDLTEPPEVGADGENIAAETIGTFLVRDKAVAWRQKSGALISCAFSLGITNAHTAGPIGLPVGFEVVCPPSNEERAGGSAGGPSLGPMRAEEGLSSGFRRGWGRRRPDHVPTGGS